MTLQIDCAMLAHGRAAADGQGRELELFRDAAELLSYDDLLRAPD